MADRAEEVLAAVVGVVREALAVSSVRVAPVELGVAAAAQVDARRRVRAGRRATLLLPRPARRHPHPLRLLRGSQGRLSDLRRHRDDLERRAREPLPALDRGGERALPDAENTSNLSKTPVEMKVWWRLLVYLLPDLRGSVRRGDTVLTIGVRLASIVRQLDL